MSLEQRMANFDQMAKRFPATRPAPLIAVYRPSAERFRQIQVAAATYMSKCLGEERFVLDEDDLLAEFQKKAGAIPNITPNGMIVPKRHLILEYNALVRAFVNIINELNIQPFISSWHIPLNLRIKFGTVNEENLKRHHPTEDVHTDSWAGESAESVTTMLFIFGDVARNHVRYYDPPAHFREEWLGALPTYRHGAEIASQYRLLDFVPLKGELVLADFATLHSSTLLPGASSRVSIDTTFALERSRLRGAAETIHPWRVNERATHEVLNRLGQSHLFVFPDSIHDRVDSQGGFKHPTNLKVVDLAE